MAATDRRFPHAAAGEGAAHAIIGERITFKITTAESGNAFLAMELASPPGGGPPLHTHPSAELFLILDGTFEFSGLDRGAPYAIRATLGDVVYIPGGDPHTYKTIGPTPGKAFAILMPGDEMERFFTEAGAPVEDNSAPTAPMGSSSAAPIARLLAAAERRGIVFLPPNGVAAGADEAPARHG